VEGDDPETMHQLMAGILEKVIEDIRQIQSNARKKTTPHGRVGQ
jgi:xylulose-5-phosphate/fructose-6-phosphate phosphoketolase